MLNQQDFLKKYNIATEVYDSTKLVWQDLEAIFHDYSSFRNELEPTAVMLFNKFMLSHGVHSVRYRVKDPEHLIEKIIRKKAKDNKSNITLENYKEEVNDLIGLRALHLFKPDWEPINEFIRKTWDIKGVPEANFREGDSEQLIAIFKEKGCVAKHHPYGYRSIHYVIISQPGKEKHYAEIQVRTIYEEAWAEIDHTIRYPYDLDNHIYLQFLLILNRLSGSADEMGSYIQNLKSNLESKQAAFNTEIEEKNRTISALEGKIEKSNIQGEELNATKELLERLRNKPVMFTKVFGASYIPPIGSGLFYSNPTDLGFLNLAPASQPAFQSLPKPIKVKQKGLQKTSDKLKKQPKNS